MLFIYIPGNDHLNCFQILAAKNKDKESLTQDFVQTHVFTSFGQIPQTGIAGHSKNACLTF